MKKPKAKARKPTALQALRDVLDQLRLTLGLLAKDANRSYESGAPERAHCIQERMIGVSESIEIVKSKIERME